MRRIHWLAIFFSSLLVTASLPAQQSPCDQGPPPAMNAAVPSGFPDNRPPMPPDPATVEIQHKQMQARNKERQASLKKDTAQLLELATELKQSVDKTNEHVLSLDVIKKTQEVEKLAKAIREKMQANGYCDFPAGQ